MIFLLFLLLLFLIFLVIIFIINFYNIIILGQAPFVSSKRKIISQVVDSLDIYQGKIIYELGAGLSLFLRQIEKRTKVNKLIAIEYAIIPYLFSKLLLFFYKSDIKLIRKNLYSVNLNQADIIYLYLMPKMMPKLAKKLNKECKKGTLIISNSFKITDLTLEKNIKVNNINIYFYRL